MRSRSNKTIVFFAVVLSFLTACSSTTQVYLDSLRLAFQDDRTMPPIEDVAKSPVDLLAVKYGERNTALLALAFIENGQHKWVAGDSALLIMNNNVITETKGLDSNRLFTSNLQDNPLTKTPISSTTWNYVVDDDSGLYSQPIYSDWQVNAQQTVTLYDQDIIVIPVIQHVSFSLTQPVLNNHYSWDNIYWVAAASGEVVYSEQQLLPKSDRLSMTYLSRIARLALEKGSSQP